MIIHTTNKQSDLPLDFSNLQAIVSEVLKLEKQSAAEVGIHFVTTKEICKLHKLYFNDPSPTDCISFPLDGPNETHYRLLGDVFVCPNTAVQYAAAHKSDAYFETTLYVVHGLLHLLGYDDIAEKDIPTMRAAEKRHMSNLKKLNLQLSPSS